MTKESPKKKRGRPKMTEASRLAKEAANDKFWNSEKDALLRSLVAESSNIDWALISQKIGQNEAQTVSRYLQLTSINSSKHIRWSAREDEMLISIVQSNKKLKWS